MAKLKELRNMNFNELNKQLDDLRMELIKSGSQVASGTAPKNPGQIKQSKKTIAKILTIIKEKDTIKKSEAGKKDE